jgi:acylphosphatase
MKTMHLIISGVVQGIGFRKWMRKHAKQLCVTGWVKNREDGAVESVIQGDADALRQFLMIVHQGPPLARIEGVVEKSIETDSVYENFIVIQ